jgi:hypothetical protein
MRTQLAAVRALDAGPRDGPVHRSIIAVDLEGSTKRTNLVKGELRRILYDLLDRALKAAGVSTRHLEQLTDRGDGVLILVRPDDDVPKTVLLGRLIPMLTDLLVEHNAAVAHPALQIRLRAVVHAGEVHDDGRGFYGEDLDVAFRLLDAPTVKRALREATASPLVLVVSEEIFSGIIRHGYVDEGPYERCVHVRVAERRRRGRVHVPVPARPDRSLAGRRAKTGPPSPSLAIAAEEGPAGEQPMEAAALPRVSGRGAPRPGPG